ncbi:unnamed protein product [Gadus morhua 'NCC']
MGAMVANERDAISPPSAPHLPPAASERSAGAPGGPRGQAGPQSLTSDPGAPLQTRGRPYRPGGAPTDLF